jgi:hypothetical protein
MEVAHELVVGLGVLDAVVHTNADHERVDRHHVPPS